MGFFSYWAQAVFSVTPRCGENASGAPTNVTAIAAARMMLFFCMGECLQKGRRG
jgi:hypothetical protein